MNIKETALTFVDSLVPDRFEIAKEMLSPDCIYSYGETELTGESIIQSFIDNHENAKSKLDVIEYIDGKVISVDENIVTVTVQDRIKKDGLEHIYTDRLILSIEHNSITKIEYNPFPEERVKLKAYLDKVKVKL